MFSTYDDDVLRSPLSNTFIPPSDEAQLYLVQYRWWNEAQESGFSRDVEGISYLSTSTFSKLNDFWDIDEFCSEIVVEMTRDDTESSEEGVSLEYALLPDWMFSRALKWHNDADKTGTIIYAKDTMQDLFSLKSHFLLGKMKVLVAKISQKDNEVGTFERACNIFCVHGGQFRIWDISGQLTQFTVDAKNIPASVLQNAGIFVELQLYGLSHIAKKGLQGKDKLVVDHSKGEDYFWSGSPKMNGSTDVTSNIGVDYQPSANLCKEASAMGLTGLLNIGNTCFMNSAIQCLVHTIKFVDYFLGNFQKDLNFENPLGRNGKLALAFGDLFKRLWIPESTPVAPSTFKSALTNFAPQFSGDSQHDSQEFLAFLLDGLHEDLNRVKCKPYIEVKDAGDVPDNEVADEHWRNHLARNDSIIVDVCQGQLRSNLVCSICKKVSVTYDPFMYLSLPLPITSVRTITLTVLSTDGSCMPIPVTVTVPGFGRFEDLVQAVSASCSLHDDETLLLAEVVCGRIWRFLDKPDDSLDLLGIFDRLVAYRLPKDDKDSSYLVIFMHQYQHQIIPTSIYTHWKKFDIPLLAVMSDISKGSKIREQFLKLLNPFLLPFKDVSVERDDVQTISCENSEIKDVIGTVTLNGHVNGKSEDRDTNDEVDCDLDVENDFQFLLIRGEYELEGTPIRMNEPLPSISSCRKYMVLVSWPKKIMNLYDIAPLSSLPENSKSSFFTEESQESISLHKCLEGFLTEEPLGPEDMWYCPKCKEHRQAIKKLDLWRLPEILVIHLKRFSYNRFFKNKLETFVDFPIEDFDLADYTVNRTSEVSQRYVLYAIINHYGGLGGGHYTAYVQGHNKWYEFDDHRVFPVQRIKTSAAYVLFYRRV